MKYKLTVSGVVEFAREDKYIKELLLGSRGEADRLEVAYQELEESAYDVQVTMEEMK